MGDRDRLARQAYQAAYYQRTAARRKQLARSREQIRRWSQWLLQELCGDKRTQPSFALPPRVHPVRRPLLTLKNKKAKP